MSVRHAVIVFAVAAALGIALFFVATAVGAGDLERGKLLYNARCVGCHDKSVHVRESRKALTIEGIRAQVRRWDAFMGGAWGQAEVDDVATYLNDLYYKFPCPPALCPEKRAAEAMPLAAQRLSR